MSTRRKRSLSKVGFHHGWVAQLAEQRTENPRVGGSIPPPAISFFVLVLLFVIDLFPLVAAAIVNPGAFKSCRIANLKSCTTFVPRRFQVRCGKGER